MKENNITDSNTVIFTVCNIAYLHKALVLADSIYCNASYTLNVFIFDRKQDLNLSNENCIIHWMEDMEIPNFLHLAFKYDIIEFSTALKPYITLELLNEYQNVIFFDPDIYVYSNIDSILSDLAINSILLTPHYTTPQSDHISESDTGMMRFGSFNLGFFAIRKSDQSLTFLNWWSRRCIDLCFMESQFGLSTDQKWVSIAPCFFRDIKVSFNLGYNVAPWNSWERHLSWESDGSVKVNNNTELLFFHFSNFSMADPGYLNARSTFETGVMRDDFFKIGIKYSNQLNIKFLKYIGHSDLKYAYNYMSNGYYISPLLRHAYASMYDSLKHVNNPFDSTSLVYKFAKNNYLVYKNLSSLGYMKNNLNKKDRYSLEIKIMNFLLRILIIIIGPNKFHMFSRGLVFFSSPRINKGLWKI